MNAYPLYLRARLRSSLWLDDDRRGLQHWHRFIGETPWLTDHRTRAEALAVMSTDVLIDRAQLVEPPFYRQCLAPHGVVAGLMMVVERSGNEITWLHLLQKGAGHVPDAKELRSLRGFRTLLAETLRLARSMGHLEALRNSFMDTVDHVSAGVALVTDGQMTCNRIAKAILAQQDGLQLVGNRLKASGDQNAVFQKLIDRALKGTSGDMSIARPSGKWAFDVSVHAVGHGRRDRSGKRLATAVHIIDPGRGQPPSTGYLREACELTRAEAASAIDLATWRSSADIAEGLGIGVETVRGHIKNILVKTGTSRQAELVANRPIV